MIKPEELRIGNFIKLDGDVFAVQSINTHIDFEWSIIAGGLTVYPSGMDMHQYGIMLTDEWLTKFGFKMYEYSKDAVLLAGSDTYVKTFSLGNLTICDWGNNKFILTNSFSFDLRVEIKTTHQLQNLYFALTGEELTIKEESVNNLNK